MNESALVTREMALAGYRVTTRALPSGELKVSLRNYQGSLAETLSGLEQTLRRNGYTVTAIGSAHVCVAAMGL